jgi:hypothetical protein
MRKPQFSIDISHKNKEKYLIYHEMTKHGKSIIEDVHKKEWWKPVSIELGIESKKLKPRLLPPVTKQKGNFAVVLPNIDIIVEEKPLKHKPVSRFFFKEIKKPP